MKKLPRFFAHLPLLLAGFCFIHNPAQAGFTYVDNSGSWMGDGTPTDPNADGIWGGGGPLGGGGGPDNLNDVHANILVSGLSEGMFNARMTNADLSPLGIGTVFGSDNSIGVQHTIRLFHGTGDLKNVSNFVSGHALQLDNLEGVRHIHWTVDFDEPITSRSGNFPNGGLPLAVGINELTSGTSNTSLGAEMNVSYGGVKTVNGIISPMTGATMNPLIGVPNFQGGAGAANLVAGSGNDNLGANTSYTLAAGATSGPLRGGAGFQHYNGFETDGSGGYGPITNLDTVIDEGEQTYISSAFITISPDVGTAFTDQSRFNLSFDGAQFNFQDATPFPKFIPEPSRALLSLAGLVCLVLRRRR